MFGADGAMPLSFAAIMPHGGLLVPGVDPDSRPSSKLEQAMTAVAQRARSAELDALIIVTPHGVHLEEVHTIGMASRIAGELGPHSIDVECDLGLAHSIVVRSIEHGLPVAGIVYENNQEPLPMDWGVFIPAWYVQQAVPLPQLVAICPTRSHGLESLVALGRVIGEIAEEGTERVGLIASADQAHAHDADGPYGFHPSADVFDRLVVEMTQRADFEKWLQFDEALIEEALPDSPWQLALLAGAFRVAPFEVIDVSYDCPSYFGMMAAEFEREPS